MEDDSSLVIHQFIDKYDDSSFKMSRKSKSNPSKISSKRASSSDSPTKRKRKPKPADMPRRPLSAYNIFFQEQRALIIGKPVSNESVSGISRAQLLPDGKGLSQPSFMRKKRAHRKTHGKISFANLAKQIGASWNSLTPEEKKKYEDGAAKEKARYQEELRLYRLNKDKEESEDTNGGNESLDGYRFRSKRLSRTSSRKSKSDDDERRQSRNAATPSGITIEYVQKKKFYPSRLRGRRYKPMNLAEKSLRFNGLDQICPLPLTFDASKCHPSEIVSEKEMGTFLSKSALLKNTPAAAFTESNDGAQHPYEERSPIPSIQTSESYVSACSLNSNCTGNDNEMADILTFFLKDGDVEKQEDNQTLNENVCEI